MRSTQEIETARPRTEAVLVNVFGDATPHELYATRRLRDGSYEVLWACQRTVRIRRWGRVWPTVIGGHEVVSALDNCEALYPGYAWPEGAKFDDYLSIAIEWLMRRGPASREDIAKYAGISEDAAREVLGTLRASGHVERIPGSWTYRLTVAGSQWSARRAA
jgi:hypothetical protein